MNHASPGTAHTGAILFGCWLAVLLQALYSFGGSGLGVVEELRAGAHKILRLVYSGVREDEGRPNAAIQECQPPKP